MRTRTYKLHKNVYSNSRTALFTLAIVSVFEFSTYLVKRKVRIGEFSILFALTCLFLIVINSSTIIDKLNYFIAKDDNGQIGIELLESARGEIMKKSFANFENNPMTGIGIGIPSDYQTIRFDSNIINSFSVEKGTIITALIEEQGILGLISFLIFFFLVVSSTKNKKFLIISILAILLINMGEYSLFSFGPLGILSWLMIFTSKKQYDEI